MIVALLVPEVQRGLIPMMAVGNVEPRRAVDLGKVVEPLRGGDRPDGVVIAVFACDRQARWLGQRGGDDRTDQRRWILVEREDRTQVGDHRPGERQPVRLGARVGLLVRQNAAAKWLQLDDPQEPTPDAFVAADRVNELVAVDVKAGTRFPAQDAIRQPLLEEAGGPRVLVVFLGVGRTHLARDQAHDVVRILPVIATLLHRADDVIGRGHHLR